MSDPATPGPCKGVLITRPEPAAHATARVVAGLGFVPVLAPMLEIAQRRLARPHGALQALLLTSANAIPSLDRIDRDVPVYAVGDATAERASRGGFHRVHSAGRDAEALAALVGERCAQACGALLLASGAGQGLGLAAGLRLQGFTVYRRVAYSAQAAASLPDAAVMALGTGTIRSALFYSAASARAFAGCMIGETDQLRDIEALAISQPTARALAPLPWLRIRVASHPNQDELVALLS